MTWSNRDSYRYTYLNVVLQEEQYQPKKSNLIFFKVTVAGAHYKW